MITTLDEDRQFPYFSPACTLCRHQTGFRACRAFTGQIPMEIWLGSNTHEQPYPGDHGIQFAPVPGAKVTKPAVAKAT